MPEDMTKVLLTVLNVVLGGLIAMTRLWVRDTVQKLSEEIRSNKERIRDLERALDSTRQEIVARREQLTRDLDVARKESDERCSKKFHTLNNLVQDLRLLVERVSIQSQMQIFPRPSTQRDADEEG